MLYTVSVTSQGQLSIPAQIRKQLGFFKTHKALVTVVDGKVVIEPVKDLLTLKGSLRSSIKATPQQIRKAFEKHLANHGRK